MKTTLTALKIFLLAVCMSSGLMHAQESDAFNDHDMPLSEMIALPASSAVQTGDVDQEKIIHEITELLHTIELCNQVGLYKERGYLESCLMSLLKLLPSCAAGLGASMLGVLLGYKPIVKKIKQTDWAKARYGYRPGIQKIRDTQQLKIDLFKYFSVGATALGAGVALVVFSMLDKIDRLTSQNNTSPVLTEALSRIELLKKRLVELQRATELHEQLMTHETIS